MQYMQTYIRYIHIIAYIILFVMSIKAYTFGKSGSKEDEFKQPSYVYFKENKLFVSDVGNHRVQIFNLESNNFVNAKEIKYSGTIANIMYPQRVIVSSNDLILIGNYNMEIHTYDQSGTFIKSRPIMYNDFVLDNSDKIIYTNYYANKIYVYEYENGKNISNFDIKDPCRIDISDYGSYFIHCANGIKVLDNNFQHLYNVQEYNAHEKEKILSYHISCSDKIILGMEDKIKILEPDGKRILTYNKPSINFKQPACTYGITSYDKNIIISDYKNDRLKIIKNIL